MGSRVLASGLHRQRIAAFQSVDRHVLGAVVLERAPHICGPAHDQQVADEDHDANCALGELQAETLIHPTYRCLGQQERQQEEDAYAEDKAQ